MPRLITSGKGTGARGPAGESGAGGGGGTTETPAPQAQFTVLSVAVTSPSGIPNPLIDGLIHFPNTDPDYAAHFARVEIEFVHSDGRIFPLNTYEKPIFNVISSTEVKLTSTDIVLTTIPAPACKLKLTSYNHIGNASTPFYTGTFALPTAGISSVTLTEVESERWKDPSTAQVHTVATVTVASAVWPTKVRVWTNQPNTSVNGAQRGHGDFFLTGASTVLKIGKNGSSTNLFTPFADENWSATVELNGQGQDPSSASPPALVTSSTTLIHKIANANAELIQDITIPTSAGGTYPWDAVATDGHHYFSIPQLSVDTTAAQADGVSFVMAITVTDIDASGHVIGDEMIYGTPLLVNGVEVIIGGLGDFLRGEYGFQGDGFVRRYPWPGGSPANVAVKRLKFYLNTRGLNETTAAWKDPTVSTLQTKIGGVAGHDHFDITVAVGGAVPDASIDATKIDPATLDDSLKKDPTTSKLGVNTTTMDNDAMNPGFETGDTRGWIVTYHPEVSYVEGGFSGPPDTISGRYRFVQKPVQSTGFPNSWVETLKERIPHGYKPGTRVYLEANVFLSLGSGATSISAALYLESLDIVMNRSAVQLVTFTATTGSWVKLSGQVTVPVGSPTPTATSRIYLDVIANTTNCDAKVDSLIITPVTTTETLSPQAVAAQNMAAAAVTAANAALGANAIVDSNVQSVSIGKLISGTVVFTGDVSFSRGSGKPVITMNNAGIYLFGTGTSGGSGVTPDNPGAPTYSATGLSSGGYVAITSTQIGVFGPITASKQPAVTVGGSNIDIWSNAGITTSPYVELTPTAIYLYSGVAGRYMQLTSTGLVIVDGPNQVATSPSGILILSSSSYVNITSNQLILGVLSTALYINVYGGTIPTINNGGQGGAGTVSLQWNQDVLQVLSGRDGSAYTFFANWGRFTTIDVTVLNWIGLIINNTAGGSAGFVPVKFNGALYKVQLFTF